MIRLMTLVYEVLDYSVTYRGHVNDTLPSELWDVLEAAHAAVGDYLDSMDDEAENQA